MKRWESSRSAELLRELQRRRLVGLAALLRDAAGDITDEGLVTADALHVGRLALGRDRNAGLLV